jgi:DNA mismatch repair protein MLH3
MTSPSPFISPLTRPTSTRLRSALVIPTFPQVLNELIQNSLDASATRVDCWVDLTPDGQSLRVEDDGSGIGLAGLKQIGARYSEWVLMKLVWPLRDSDVQGEE